MALFAISYDLVKDKDYQTLWDELDRLGAHKALNSFYLANLTCNTAAEARDHLSQFIDSDDRLIVVEFNKKPRHQKAFTGTNDWITDNV